MISLFFNNITSLGKIQSESRGKRTKFWKGIGITSGTECGGPRAQGRGSKNAAGWPAKEILEPRYNVIFWSFLRQAKGLRVSGSNVFDGSVLRQQKIQLFGYNVGIRSILQTFTCSAQEETRKARKESPLKGARTCASKADVGTGTDRSDRLSLILSFWAWAFY